MLARALLLLVAGVDSTPPPTPSLIPRPAAIQMLPGEAFDAGGAVVELSDSTDAELRRLGDLAASILADAGSSTHQPAESAVEPPAVRLVLDSGTPMPAEGYRLEAHPNVLSITGATPAGVFYGLQTLRQLLPLDRSGRVPGIVIDDAPRFPYRGMHLDVSRHVFPVAFIERYIDLLARYKLNTFHWHLTDDQGWRLQILRYPRLTEVGAWRRETVREKQLDPYVGDGQPYGGFYTQQEVREIVAYARARFVTVIPEIELPGHATAALAAYPQLACTVGPFLVSTTWGVHEDVFCPSERTFAFLEDVLTEVMDLFPSRYIHIGGDEVPKTRWHESPVAQQVMRREGLHDEGELQSYFIRRIEAFLLQHGRRLIGWDEILQGGLAPEATVMSWRGMAGGIEAANQGHDVIMTPASHLYFDHYQGPPETEPLAIGGFSPLEHVYGFEPVPPELSPAAARHVLGAQANVWTEYIQTPEQVEYMALPRMLALAEVVWSPAPVRSWDDFSRRLPARLAALDRLGVHYRIPDPLGLDADILALGDSATVTLASPLPTARILYSLDAPAGTRTGLYDGPLAVPLGERGARIAARLVLPDGRLGPLRVAAIRRTTLQAPAAPDTRSLDVGLTYDYYEGTFRRAADLRRATARGHGIATTVELPDTERDERFGLRFLGYLHVPLDGVYEFGVSSDDGSMLRIGGETVVDYDGGGVGEGLGQIALAAGYHSIELLYVQASGGKHLGIQVRRDGGAWEPLPPTWLARRR